MAIKNRKVLILDDDRLLAQMMSDYLSVSAACDVTLTHSENCFWREYQNTIFDLIFMDYRLPDCSGLDILAKLTASQNKIPVVMMTGEGSEEIAVKAMQCGAFDYLVKGHFEFAELPELLIRALHVHEIEEQIQSSKLQIEYQAALIDNLRDAVVVWNLENKITFWNAIATHLFGLSADATLGKNVNEIYFPIFTNPPELTILDQLSQMEIERQYTGRQNEVGWVSSKITPLFDESKKTVIGYMDVARDISARKIEQERHLATQHSLEKIIASSPDLIYIANIDSQLIRFINPQVENLLGFIPYAEENKQFFHFAEIIHPADIPALEAHHQAVKTEGNGKRFTIEFRIKDNQNDWRWFSAHETVFSRNENNRPSEMIGIAQDITARKIIESKLQQRLIIEKLLSSISNFFININPENTDMGVEKSLLLVGNFIRPDFGAIYLTEEKDKLKFYCGFEKAVAESNRIAESAGIIDLAQFPWLKYHLEKQETFLIKSMEELQAGALPELEFFTRQHIQSIVFVPMIYNNSMIGVLTTFMTKNTLEWQQDHIHLLQTFADMVVNAIVQKKVSEELLSSEARYRAIVEEHQTELICRLDPSFKLSFVNETFCNYYHKTRSELIGLPSSLFIHPDDYSDVQKAILSCTPQKPVTRFEIRTPLNHNYRWQEWTARAIYDDNDTIIDYQEVGRDITQRKEIEFQLKTAQTHLAQNSRMAAIGELAASIAHQISNPLTTIIAEAQMLVNSIPNDRGEFESASAIVQAGWRAEHVIQELLKFSEAPKNCLEPVSINETIEKAILLAGLHIQNSGLTTLKVELEANPSFVLGNIQQLEDLWVTLLLLARNATNNEQKHTVIIRSAFCTQTNEIKVLVMDDGMPLSPAQMENIFEPQLVPTGEGRGTGIELSLCREIVRQHQGQISVKINDGLTIFEISLPGERKNDYHKYPSN